jgi:hypothetical protein
MSMPVSGLLSLPAFIQTLTSKQTRVSVPMPLSGLLSLPTFIQELELSSAIWDVAIIIK